MYEQRESKEAKKGFEGVLQYCTVVSDYKFYKFWFTTVNYLSF